VHLDSYGLSGVLVFAVSDGVCYGFAQYLRWDARKFVPVQTENHHVGTEFVKEQPGCLLYLCGCRSVDLDSAIIGMVTVSIPEDFDERFAK
jgi:hypothetical protein